MTTPKHAVREPLRAGSAVDPIGGATRMEAAAALPLYYRIGEAIISALNEDKLPDMMAFPSDRVLGEPMGVVRNTIGGVRRYLHDRGHLENYQRVRYLTRDTSSTSVRRRYSADRQRP
jgi:DNA-binding transcriptional regulator YhcF (GntR family)